jgi:uncharacterized membrane protein
VPRQTSRSRSSSRRGPPPPRRGRGRSGSRRSGGGSSFPGDYRKVFKGSFGSYNHHPTKENDNILACLSYIFGFIVGLIILLVVKPMSPWLRFHLIQSMTLSVILVGAYVILSTISGALVVVLIGLICLPLVQLFFLAGWIYMIIIGIMCFSWKDHRVPYIADWVEKTFV